jgi:hypothetical protein
MRSQPFKPRELSDQRSWPTIVVQRVRKSGAVLNGDEAAPQRSLRPGNGPLGVRARPCERRHPRGPTSNGAYQRR